jgi:hypothetical protein
LNGLDVSGNTGKKRDDEAPEDDLAAGLEALGTDTEGSVLVWRFKDGKFAMLTRIAARDFDPWTIGAKFGAGRYRFDFKDGRNKYVKRAIEREIEAPPVAPVAPQAPAAVGVSPYTGLDPIAMLIQSSERAQRLQEAMMIALIQNLGHGPSAAGGGIGLQDIVAIMREARESAAASAPPAPHATMLELLREGMNLGQQITSPGDGEGSGMSAMFPKLLDVISRVLPAPGAPAPVAALPAGPGNPGNPGAARGAAVGDPVNEFLSLFAPQLIQAASSGQDPTAFARLVVNMTPRGPMLGALRRIVFATPEGRRAAFTAGAPALLPYADWIDRASDAARGFLTERPAVFTPRNVPAAPAPASPAVVEAAAVENENDDGDDEDRCDDPDCTDPDCQNPDHYGCDDPDCDDLNCTDPEHFEDEDSKAAAIVRRNAG